MPFVVEGGRSRSQKCSERKLHCTELRSYLKAVVLVLEVGGGGSGFASLLANS